MNEALIGRTLGGKYHVDEIVGRGAVGTVFRATQLALGRPVAVKVLHPELAADPTALERFRREALAAARLAHRNIVTVHQFETDPEVGTYIVMELLEGETLRELLDRLGGCPWPLAVRIARDVCAAVQAAHDAGLVHRDLKPENVFLVGAGDDLTAKVLDFGIAKLWEPVGPVENLTVTGHVLGTPSYMSPEQCLGDETGPASDVYAIGCVLYELLAGRPPFVGADPTAVLSAHVATAPAPLGAFLASPHDVPAAIEAAVMRALAKAPGRRFESAEEMNRTLRVAAGVPAAGVPAAATYLLDRSAATVETSAPESSERSLGDSLLPHYLTSLVGRERDLAAVAGAFSSTRLLTLTGPGGIGKTRMAAEVASRLACSFERTRTAELAALDDPRLVAKAVAAALGASDATSMSPEEAAIAAVGPSRVLLVLDNCEHVVDACAEVTFGLLRSCSGLHVLATSREVLGVAGETVWPVTPLSVPLVSAGLVEIQRSEAVRLFCARAMRGAASFALGPNNAEVVGAICRRLDGIPLAIELAAARVKVLSARQILERLEDRFRLLTGGDRSSFPRQQTLRATVDWSYDLLTEEERALLRRLSVFVGGWTLAAAEAVCRGEGRGARDESDVVPDGWRSSERFTPDTPLAPHPSALAPNEVLQHLERLVDKSLVNVVQDGDGEPRYHLLETIRIYAEEKLRESGEEQVMAARHAAWYADLAVRAKQGYVGPGLESWLATLAAEHDNLRRAIGHLVDSESTTEAALATCCAVGWYWNLRGHLSEGRRWFERVFAACPNAPDALRAEALHEAANLAERQGDLLEARTLYERSLALRRTLGDRRGIALTLHNLGINATDRGEPESAREFHGEAIELFREVGDAHGVAIALNGIAVAERYLGRFDAAFEHTIECLDMCRGFRSERAVGVLTYNLGTIQFARGDIDEAERLLDEGLAIGRKIGERGLEANALNSLATAARARGDLERAARCCAEALEIRRKTGDTLGMTSSLAEIALIEFDRGDFERALVLGVAALTLRESLGGGTADIDEAAVRATIERCRERLGPSSEIALAEGRTMSTERAVAYGFETLGLHAGT